MTAIVLLAALQNPTAFEGQSTLDKLNALSAKESWSKLPIGERVAKTATALIGTPYVGWTLERDVNREFCYVTLNGLDCVTLFENSLAYARALAKTSKPSSEELVRQVQSTRYRDGKVDGYLSRLHYTGEWMFENVRRKNVAWVHTFAAKPYRKRVTFMSSHPDSYRQLKADPDLLPLLRDLEETHSGRTLIWIPKDKVAGIERDLETGDIIGIATSTTGMDCSHTGLIVRKGDEALFLHASSTQKKVVLDKRISEYLSRSEKNLGIIVVRPLEVAP